MVDEKLLIEKIQDHAKKVGCGNTAVEAGYQLAHEHIVDIVRMLSKHNKRNKQKGISAPPNVPVIPPLKPVVFCKDCKVPHNKFTGCPYMNGLIPQPEHFCSYGQRKD